MEISWSVDALIESVVHPVKCKHDIDRGKCLSIECHQPSNIPVRGEKSWDSALQQPNGGTFQNLFQSPFHITPMKWTYQFQFPSNYLSWYHQAEKPSPPKPEPDATTRSMPVIGYRSWRVVQTPDRDERGRFIKNSGPTVYLQSVNGFRHGNWQPGVTTAKCIGYAAEHKAPNYHCECGLYVLADLASAPHWYSDQGTAPDVLTGAVVGWGDVIQHGDEGWRAEFAKPIAFLRTDVFADQPLLYKAAEQFGVPIMDRKGLQLLAAEYGESFKGTKD
jgi:hypothetical protein